MIRPTSDFHPSTALDLNPATADQPRFSSPQKPGSTWLKNLWSNWSFRRKLLILLVGSAAIPLIVVTQALVAINKNRAIADFSATLEGEGQGFTDEYVIWSQLSSEEKAINLAKLVKATNINLSNPGEVQRNQTLLAEALAIDNASNDSSETHVSFQILTDNSGQIVAEDIQVIDPSASASEEGFRSVYRSVSPPLGTALTNIPIVREVLSSGEPLSGIEPFTSGQLERLDLQSQLGSNTPQSADAPAGIISVSVQPVEVNGQRVGLAITGLFLNNHNDIAAQFSEWYGVPISAAFTTTDLVMINDPAYEAEIESQADAAVKAAVLEQGEPLVDEMTIDGQVYLAHYRPLYDHQALLQPDSARPVGMTLVARPLAAATTDLRQQQLISYGIGGGMWLLAGILSFPVAASFSSPIRRLTQLAGEIAAGRSVGSFAVAEDRQDEIGILSQELSRMTSRLSEEGLRQESEQLRLLTNITGARTSNRQELSAVFDRAVQEAQAALNVDRLVFYRLNSDGSSYIEAESSAPEWAAASQVVGNFQFPEALLNDCQSGYVFPISRIADAGLPLDYLSWLKAQDVKAHLISPVLGNNQLLGILIADQFTAAYDWKSSEIEFLKQLSNYLGLIIDRFVLLAETRQLAEEQRQSKDDLQRRALELLQEVDPISRGDLTIRAKVTPDEIGTIADSYNATVDNLRKILLQVREAANQVVLTTDENETSVRSLSTESLRQAEEVATALAQIRDMTDIVRAAVANAEAAEAAVKQAAQTVEEGDAAMNRTVAGIQAIQTTAEETSQKVRQLGEASQEISTVVGLISSFADQTNMLALNASIEASRAGRDGTGFAVIAKEVQALAQQSELATKEIRSLVAGIQTGTQEVATAMEIGAKQVVLGTQLVDETRHSLNKITAASEQISDLVKAIVQAAVMQSRAAEAVTETMQDVAAIANKTSDEANYVSSSFDQLRKVAQALQQSVGQFKISDK